MAQSTVPEGEPSSEQLHTALQGAAPKEPFEVGISVQVEQVVSINQRSENFEVVGNQRLDWYDSKLAFDEEAFGVSFRMFTREAFARFVDEKRLFAPAFTIDNQQGRRFTQNEGALVFSDGHATYGERFTAQLQAPEFDFVQYPFDTQNFYVHVKGVLPLEYMRFVPIKGGSHLGKQLGEEEWIFGNPTMHVDEVVGVTGKPTSSFSFSFKAHRHRNYYWLRIFLPLAIIIVVSWMTFLLGDFSKRVDIAGANLLIVVAFNFTISNDLPRLGYLTFMDAIVMATFVFSAAVVMTNLIFKRMEAHGRELEARRIDKFAIWIYPVTLVTLVLVCSFGFIFSK